MTFWGSLVLQILDFSAPSGVPIFLQYLLLGSEICNFKLIPYFSGTIKEPTIFAIYFETLGVRDMQFRNQSVFSIWMWVITKSFQMTFWGSLVLLKLIPYFSATIKPSVFAIYFETLGVRDMQFRNQSVLSMLMWIITETFQITFWGSLVLLKLIPYFSVTIKSTIFAIYFDTFGVRDMQFRNQSVLSMLMWIITKTFQITFWGSLVLLKLIPYFSGTIKPTIFAIYFETLGVRDMQFRNQSVFSIWMWVITKSFQMTFWGSLVLLKLIPYFSATIKPSIFAIYFETLGVRDMQFRNQSVLSMLMWIITKSFQITFWGSLVLLKLIPYFSAIKSTYFDQPIYFLRLWGSEICNFGINLYYQC